MSMPASTRWWKELPADATTLVAEILGLDNARMAARPKTGIYARTMLPSPTYDHCFTLETINGACCCVFKRDGSVTRIIADYFEEVPAP